MMRTVDELLAETPVFAGMETDRVATIAGCAHHVVFQAGETLYQEGGPADEFYVIRHGTVAVQTFVPVRGEVTIETVGEGGIVGWSWLFPPYRLHFDARAVTLVRASAIDGTCLRAKCEKDPALGYDLMSRLVQVLIERMQATRLRLLDVYGHHDQR
jgi:CRP-like cAMP-binding protein